MITPFRACFGGLILALVMGLAAWAVDPAASPTTGRVLILQNERTLEGNIERVGNQYRIRREMGETWVSADQVLKLCATAREAYLFLRSRWDTNDPVQRLKLVHWCRDHGLREEAQAECRAVLAGHSEQRAAQRLLEDLIREVLPAPPKANPVPAALTHSPSPDGEGVKVKAADATKDLPSMDMNIETLAMFSNRVQPILMNTCVSCHHTTSARRFKLERTFSGTVVDQRATQQNLLAVLAQINWDRIEASPLLVKSVSGHGGVALPPLKSRQTMAYRILEEWVQTAMANNPQLREREPKNEVKPIPPAKQPELKSVPPPQPTSPTETLDPYDPMIFNREMHDRQGNCLPYLGPRLASSVTDEAQDLSSSVAHCSAHSLSTSSTSHSLMSASTDAVASLFPPGEKTIASRKGTHAQGGSSAVVQFEESLLADHNRRRGQFDKCRAA